MRAIAAQITRTGLKAEILDYLQEYGLDRSETHSQPESVYRMDLRTWTCGCTMFGLEIPSHNPEGGPSPTDRRVV